MIDYGVREARVAVIGRTRFDTDIGAIGYGTAELLARHFPVAYLPTEPEARAAEQITLPNGRRLPVCAPGTAVAASVFCDVISNGAGDDNAALIPSDGLRYAWLLFDSDALPARWVDILNRQVDIVLVPSAALEATARRSGVVRPVHRLPIPLDLDPVLARPIAPRAGVATFGSVAAFNPRARIDTLVKAFRLQFGDDPGVRLVLHSYLAFGPALDQIRMQADGAANVQFSHGALSAAEKDALIASFDVFVSCSQGEGDSIGPREALAAGAGVVASALGGHIDLAGLAGVFLVPPARRVPAHYPKIDDGMFGWQDEVDPASLGIAMAQARSHAERCDNARLAAETWSFSALASSIGALIDPAIARYHPTRHPPAPEVETAIEARLGRRGDAIGGIRRQVCPAHDGGFFSVFNTFFSHLAWQEREDRCHAVLPDWDIDRFLARIDGTPRSFCYGQPGDGNLWCRLFQPLFGASDAEMQDEAYLWRHAEFPLDRHNEAREPLLTYVRAYTLYRSPEFEAWRRQYHRVLCRHVHLRPDLALEVEAFARTHLTAPTLIAAHVRHPSHTVEQPDGRIAGTRSYIDRIRSELRRRGVDPDGQGWTVFVATDQARVLQDFHAAFGRRAVFYPDVRRTRADEDAVFEALSFEERNREGHQLQHLVAADPSGWSWQMAREVVRDAYTMARCHSLLHVVSNVSTAVAYLNPEIEMIFCQA